MQWRWPMLSLGSRLMTWAAPAGWFQPGEKLGSKEPF
jgi:hypothetical protein